MNFVGLTQPSNKARLEALIGKLEHAALDQAADKVVYDSFKGWTIIAAKQATIDRFEQESNATAASLADDKSFTESMDRLGSDSVVRAFVNGKF